MEVVQDRDNVQDTIFRYILEYCYLHLLVYKPNLKYYFIYNRLVRYETNLLLMKTKMINNEVLGAIESIINAQNQTTTDNKLISDSLVKIYIRYVADNNIPDDLQYMYNLLMLSYATGSELTKKEIPILPFYVDPFADRAVVRSDKHPPININRNNLADMDWDKLYPNIKLQLIYLTYFYEYRKEVLTNLPVDCLDNFDVLISSNVLFYKSNVIEWLPAMYYLEALNVMGKDRCISCTVCVDIAQISRNDQLKRLYNIEFNSNLVDVSKSFENLYHNVISLEADDADTDTDAAESYATESDDPDDDIDVGESDSPDTNAEDDNSSDGETDSDNIEDTNDAEGDTEEEADVYLQLDDGKSKTKLDDFIFRSTVARMNDSLQRQTDPGVSGEDLSTLNSICKYWLWKIPTDTTKALLKKLKLNSCLKGF